MLEPVRKRTVHSVTLTLGISISPCSKSYIPLTEQCFVYVFVDASDICASTKHVSLASAERVGQGEVGGVTRRVTCTCWQLWLSVEMPWLAVGDPILALFAQIGLENTALTL